MRAHGAFAMTRHEPSTVVAGLQHGRKAQKEYLSIPVAPWYHYGVLGNDEDGYLTEAEVEGEVMEGCQEDQVGQVAGKAKVWM